MMSATLLILAMTPGVGDTTFESGFDDPDGCPNGRQSLADILYLAQCARHDVDMTEWSNIWGYSCGTGGTTPFPGLFVEPTILNFGKTTYIAAHFHVPADLSPNTYGWISHTNYNYGQDLTASISPNCGDFSATTPACFINSQAGQNLVPWAVPPPATFCPLVPGQDYFFNVKMTDPTRPSNTCDAFAAVCAISLPNNFHVP